MSPVIKVTSQCNSVCTGILDVKFNTLLPLVYVRGLVVFHGALLSFFLGAYKKYCTYYTDIATAFTRLVTQLGIKRIKMNQIQAD
jgi:hypothetical protein